MEKAVFITEASEFKNWSGEYSRVYFGNEFCQRLIPAKEKLEDILDFVLSKGLNFTFVTGFVTEPALDYLQDLFAVIFAKSPNSEIVINDWGMLGIVRKYNLIPVVGRLLTKQRRDPRIMNLRVRLTEEALERSKAFSIGSHLSRFLKNNAVERIEIDNLPQGIGISESVKSEGLHLSLYFPFNYVTTSRRCIFDNNSLRSEGCLLPECEKKCKSNPIVLRHSTMPLPLYMKGNTLFLENQKMPDYPALGYIDRIVYQPHIPM
jgi:hypothetical protein